MDFNLDSGRDSCT